MIEIKREGIILKKTENVFENEGVLNPAVIREGDNVHMFYRAVSKGNYSSIGYCCLDGPLTIRHRDKKPVLKPEFEYESHGVEDARIVKIDNLYYLTFTAYDGTNAQGALAVSKDLRSFRRKGIIVPTIAYVEFVKLLESSGQVNARYYKNHEFYFRRENIDKRVMLWDKNVIFFPRRINGKLCFLHRIRPGIQLVMIKDLKKLTKKYWEDYCKNLKKHIIMDPCYKHESSYIGGGCPPVETREGWLIIYHGVEKTSRGLVYSACASLLDLDDPSKEIARLPYALFSPLNKWEQKGEVNNVVFPTGTALFGETLFIYYGAADEQIACVSVSIQELLRELIKNPMPHDKTKTK